MLPIVSQSWSRVGALKEFFFAARYFGTGIIIATALVHLLYHAFVMFNNSCLLGKLAFEPAAGLICIGAIYLVLCVVTTIRRVVAAFADNFYSIVDLFSLRYIRGLRTAQGVTDKASEETRAEPKFVIWRSVAYAVLIVLSRQELPYSHGHFHGDAPIDQLQAKTELWLLEAGIIFQCVFLLFPAFLSSEQASN